MVEASWQWQRAVQLSGWVLVAMALLCLQQQLGWEYAIPVFLGLLSAAGLSSLLIAALVPSYHSLSAAVCMTYSLMFALIHFAGGVA